MMIHIYIWIDRCDRKRYDWYDKERDREREIKDWWIWKGSYISVDALTNVLESALKLVGTYTKAPGWLGNPMNIYLFTHLYCI